MRVCLRVCTSTCLCVKVCDCVKTCICAPVSVYAFVCVRVYVCVRASASASALCLGVLHVCTCIHPCLYTGKKLHMAFKAWLYIIRRAGTYMTQRRGTGARAPLHNKSLHTQTIQLEGPHSP